MTSSTESVEIVEVTWKIPNFRQFVPGSPSYSEQNVPYFKVVLIGGRLPPACPQSKSPPVKLEVGVYRVEGLFKFVAVLHKLQTSSPCTISGRFLEFKTCKGLVEYTFAEGMNSGDGEAMDVSEQPMNITLFEKLNAAGYMDKMDGSLNIYFKMEITCSCPEPNGGMEFTEMSSGFESLLKNPTQSDVEIKVTRGEGQTFQCHKAILAGRSKVFRAMFESDMKESKANVVEVEDILPKTMEHFLSFVYCGRFQDSSWIGSLPELVYASDKYCVNSLKNICDLNLILSVKPQNAMALGILAERHGLTKAAKDIRKFIAENVYAVTLEPNSDTSSGDANFNVRYSVPFQE